MKRFWDKVEIASLYGCWEWMAAKNHKGYGEFRLDGKVQRAHRVAYELVRGSIPEGLEIHHQCRNRACVHPYHIEPIDHKTHVSKEYCPVGHRRSPNNLYGVHCKTCQLTRKREHYQEHREEIVEKRRKYREMYGDKINARRRQLWEEKKNAQ